MREANAESALEEELMKICVKKKKKKRQIYSKYHVHEGQMSFWGILGNCFTNSSLILYILLLLLSSTLFIDIMAKTSEHGCRGYSNGKIEC